MRETLHRTLLSNLVITVGSILLLATSVYAGTACQSIQQTVDAYIKGSPSIYCKYTPEFGDTEIKIWRDCDYRSVARTTTTYSAGSVDQTSSGTTTCCRPNLWCGDPKNTYTQSYTNTYYKTKITTEYCDGHSETNEWPYGTVIYHPFYSIQGTCGSPGNSVGTTQVEQGNTDCSAFVTHSLISTISIPADCNNCFGSSDPCCGSTDPCCGSKDPCCGKPDCDQCPLQ